LQITVLGCYGPYPAAGGACSGYLLQEEDVSILLDCGNGVLSRLRYYLEPWELEAVVLSHLHGDHISDLFVMRYALQLHEKALKIYAPAEPAAEFARLPYKNFLQAEAVREGSMLNFGSMKITFLAGVHAFQSHLVKVESKGKTFVYSGDTEYFSGMEGFISGADMFLCEANYLRQDVELGRANHMAAFQAAEAATKAGVKRLVLTHHHPEIKAAPALAEAREIYPAVEAASAGSVYKL
jgi:ribonuclease BN (tRNA processing enzyme)